MNIQGDIMYKVAIVDDEPVIVRGLTKMIPWESYNCRVVGTAGDGQEGMKLIREQKPDILISDICMPGIDGLTMIAGMKSECRSPYSPVSGILTMPSRPSALG